MQINFKKMTISHTLYRKTWNTWSNSSAQLPGAVVLPGQREHGPHHTQKQRVLMTNKHFAGASHAPSACSVLPPAPWEPRAAMHQRLQGPSEAHEHQRAPSANSCQDNLDQDCPSPAERLLSSSSTAIPALPNLKALPDPVL